MSKLSDAKAEIQRKNAGLREALSMLKAVSLDEECGAADKRSWKAALKRVRAALRDGTDRPASAKATADRSAT